MMMCRFRDKNDEGYNKVKGVVSRYMDEIQTQVAKESAYRLFISDNVRYSIMLGLDLERQLLMKGS
jgi:hypothetical protein